MNAPLPPLALGKGDLVWVDNAAFIASPEKTGRATMCEVVLDSPEHVENVYVAPCGVGSPQYVWKSQLTEPDGFRLGRKKP